MAYTLSRERTVEENVGWIAGCQLEEALADLDAEELDVHASIHEVRKRCKMIRALLRLTRPVIEDLYEAENAALRDAARLVSYERAVNRMHESFAEADTETWHEWRKRVKYHRYHTDLLARPA